MQKQSLEGLYREGSFKNFAKFTGNTCNGVSGELQRYWKRGSSTGVFLRILENWIWEYLPYKTTPVGASEQLKKKEMENVN